MLSNRIRIQVLIAIVLLPSMAAAQSELPAGQSLMDFVEAIKPSAVSVIIDDGMGTDLAAGSGFFIDADLVVTNHNMVAQGVQGRVHLPTGEMIPIAGVVARDEEASLVILRIERPAHLDASKTPALEPAASPAVVGDEVVMISSPMGREAAVAIGTVTGRAEVAGVGDVFELEANFVPGSTGSPVVGSNGKLIGVASFKRSESQTQKFAIPAGRITKLLGSTGPLITLVDYHAEFGEAAGARAIDPNAKPEELKLDATIVTQPDGSLLVDDRYVIRGKGTKENPYRVSWDLLISASRVYEPRQGRTKLPERVTLLHNKWVELTGFLAFPLMAEETDELLLMLNQWDGCCVGVPPTPYDAVEVTLVAPMKGESGVNIFNYGTIEGLFKVDPYVVNNWLVGLYLLEDATVELER